MCKLSRDRQKPIRRTDIAASLSALLIAASVGTGAMATEHEQDADALEKCIESTGETAALRGASCIHLITGPCENEPGGWATTNVVKCLQRERDAWDVLLNRYYQVLRQTEPEPARTTLRDSQRAWLAFRDQECRYAYERFQGGSMRLVAGATCERDRTAERVLHLWAYSNFGN